jgi:AsmA protein
LWGEIYSTTVPGRAAPPAPTATFKFDMSGVQAKPVLDTFAHFSKLSGTAEANVDVTASGSSEAALVGSLAGKGAVTFRNGSLEGIDLVNIMKMIQSRLATMNVGQGKTDFVEMGGTFTIANGVAHNTDLKMKGPLVQATGAGDIDLPRKYVQYRVTPVLTASSAAENAQGISVPVDIRGPFSDISILPDYKSVITDIARDPNKVRGQVKDVAKQVHDSLKDIRKNPGSALQNLLGGGIPGLTPPQQEQPAQEQPAPQQPAAP